MLEPSQKLIFEHIKFATPDIFAGVSFVLLLMIKLIFDESNFRKLFSKAAIILCLINLIVNFTYNLSEESFANQLFFYDKHVYFIKTLLMCSSVLGCLVMSVSNKFDSTIYLMMFGIICSLMFCLSANNFLILILGIEGIVLSVSFLLLMEQSDAIERKNATKYLLLSSIATGFFLYGSSLYYSKFGSLCFFYINNSNSLIFIFGTILILGALLFEIHAAPFHSWAIDVYENAPLGVVLFFDTIFQFFMFFIFARMLDIFISKCILFYKPFLIVVSILSMLIGGIMPIKQNSIRKFIAYASVGHIGFILSILATANYAIDFKYSMFYISSYIVASACFFFSIFILNTIQPIKNFSDMKGAISEVPIIGYSILLSMFSMIGLPPFVNFIAKLRVINFLIDNNSWSLLVVSLLYSVLTIIYTVRAARYLFTTSKSKTQKAYEKQKIKLAFCPIVILILGVFVSSQIEESFSKIFAHLE